MSENAESKQVDKPDVKMPDIDLVNADQWRSREFPLTDGRRENSVRVVIKQSVLNDIHRHGQSTTDVEVCGVLVGAGYRDERGPFVYIEANIRGRHSDSKAAQVTFTGETWNHIHNELDRDYPELQILGWYHTHPGFGIFLSGMDLFIHENYFAGEHQLAFVYDPIGGDEGLFVWRNGKAVRDGFLVVPDAQEDPPPIASAPPSEPITAGAQLPESRPKSLAVGDEDLRSRMAGIEKRQTFAEMGIFAAVALAFAVPLVIWLMWIEPRMPQEKVPASSSRQAAPAPAAGKPASDASPNPPQQREPDEREPAEESPRNSDSTSGNSMSDVSEEDAESGDGDENDNHSGN
jgi:proteasome lid subunit RPN8/RPN11